MLTRSKSSGFVSCGLGHVILSIFFLSCLGLPGMVMGEKKGQSARGGGDGWGWGSNHGHQGQGHGGWGGGAGNSQQYHYSSHGSQDGGYGLSFDVNTGLSAIGAIIVLLAMAAIAYPFLGKSHGHGWDRSDINNAGNSVSSSTTSKNLNLMGNAEKVWSALEKFYTLYNDNKSV